MPRTDHTSHPSQDVGPEMGNQEVRDGTPQPLPVAWNPTESLTPHPSHRPLGWVQGSDSFLLLTGKEKVPGLFFL